MRLDRCGRSQGSVRGAHSVVRGGAIRSRLAPDWSAAVPAFLVSARRSRGVHRGDAAGECRRVRRRQYRDGMGTELPERAIAELRSWYLAELWIVEP